MNVSLPVVFSERAILNRLKQIYAHLYASSYFHYFQNEHNLLNDLYDSIELLMRRPHPLAIQSI